MARIKKSLTQNATWLALLSLGAVWLNMCNFCLADNNTPSLYLGQPTQLMVQPYVSVEVLEETSPGVYTSLGPSSETTYMDIGGYQIPISEGRNSLLLDTGANGILIVDQAAQDLEDAGYQVEGEFWEVGVGGYTPYDVSAPYRFSFTGSDGVAHYLDGANNEGIRLISSPDQVLAASIAEGGIPGLVGMPAMTGRVVTLDMGTSGSTPSGSMDEWDIWELIEYLSSGTSIATSFSDSLPAGSTNRYTVALDNRLQFSAEEGLPDGASPDAPLPEYADVPFLTAKATNVGTEDGVYRETEGTFLLDTGAQFSIISRRMAFALGLDDDGDGDLDEGALDYMDVSGVGGTRSVPILCFDELRLPTEEGIDLVFYDPSDPEENLGVQVLVMDLFTCADINFDGIVDQDDIDTIIANRGSIVPEGDIPSGDIDCDGDVDDDDLAIAIEQEGETVFIDGVFGIDMLTSGRNLNVDSLTMEGTSFFDSVHFDFLDWENGTGTLVLDVNSEYNTVVEPDIPGDINGDGRVDGSDVTILANHWQYGVNEGETATPEMGDLNGDGRVDGSDVTILANHWQEGVGSSTQAAVPEPTGWALLISLGLFGLYRRKKKA